jgi:hypothetical protein
MATLATNFVKGQTLTCKYPKHGRMNILKRHTGTIKAVGCSVNGIYATIHQADGTYRSLLLSKMIDPVAS